MTCSTSRRAVLVGAAALIATSAAAQTPASGVKFTQAAFDAAQSAGKSVIVEVTAPWCPTCKAQAPIIKSLMEKPEFRNLVVLDVDFDSQKEVLKALRVSAQSTLIAFKARTETGRSTGDTTAAGIEKLFKSAI